MIDLAPHVRPGTGVWWGQAGGEPTPLVHALLDQADVLGPVRAFCGMSWDRRLTTALPDSVALSSYGAIGALRVLTRAGRLDVVACHYSALPRLFAERALPADVGLVQVSPPDADGRCTLGVGVDWAADAVAHTPVLIAEINARMPRTEGGPLLPLDRFAAVVHTDRPLAQALRRAPDDTDRAIARHVAALVEDGDTIQIGVGSLPAAVLDALTDHADLGVHTGLIDDAVARLIGLGVITGARKEIDAGVVVTGAALGSSELYDRVRDLPAQFRAASYTHAPAILGRLRSFVSINSALQVDLAGQVNAEQLGGRYLGGIGGQADFSHAAAVSGARSVIALRAAGPGGSTIVGRLADGVVTTTRADVDFVVTEHGAAELRGATEGQRAERLIAVADPAHRDDLHRYRSQHRHRQEGHV